MIICGETPLTVIRDLINMDRRLRRKDLLSVLLAVLLVLSGCLTLNPAITVVDSDTTVFENITVTESWSSQRVRAEATFSTSPDANNVTRLTVIDESGKPFSSIERVAGQTRIIFELPVNQNVTLVATDVPNGTTIETLNITTSGDTVP